MKRLFRRSAPADADLEVGRDHELRLVNAETRANSVYEKAARLHTIVTRRDQANHWQESVNRLFSGGTP